MNKTKERDKVLEELQEEWGNMSDEQRWKYMQKTGRDLLVYDTWSGYSVEQLDEEISLLKNIKGDKDE